MLRERLPIMMDVISGKATCNNCRYRKQEKYKETRALKEEVMQQRLLQNQQWNNWGHVPALSHPGNMIFSHQNTKAAPVLFGSLTQIVPVLPDNRTMVNTEQACNNDNPRQNVPVTKEHWCQRHRVPPPQAPQLRGP